MAGRIRESDIAEVRDRTRVDEVIGEYVALRRAGAGSLKGLCPFHDEKTPSFNVRPSHGTFHCFGCGEGGDAVAFLMKMDHIGFVEAVERLAERVGFRLTYEGGGSSVQRDRGTRSRLIEANKRAAEFYAAQLRTPEAAPAVQFLTTRGFDVTAAQHFGCGFAPAGWDLLTKHLLAAGFTLDELMKAGLSKEGRRGPIDRFHRRLLWSIKDLGGDVVGFGARRLFDDDGIEAKYLNTTETPVYRKTHVLFGLDLAKREIAKRRQVVVVEGYTDVMAMHQAGVTTAVASCGTAFGAEHISVIRRLIGDDSFDLGEVIYTFDGDAAGQAAALKAFEGDQSFAAQTFVAVAPDGQDPCELRQAHGDTAVRDLVARREPLFEFAIRSMLRDYKLDTAEGRVAALQRTVPLVARIKREELRDEYARRLAG
ncbi:MAG: DNA primase, partial [Pseudonocardia sp.]